MDLTSIDSNFTCTEELALHDIYVNDVPENLNIKWLILNNYKRTFPWGWRELSAVISGYGNSTEPPSLNIENICKKFCTTKYALNNYNSFNFSIADSADDVDYIIHIINDLPNASSLWETVTFDDISYSIPLCKVQDFIETRMGSSIYPATLINLLYSVLYNSDGTKSTIDKNNLILFYLIPDIYMALAPKLTEGSDTYIEHISKPIILQSTFEGGEGFYEEDPLPSPFNDTNMKCLSNKINDVLNNLYSANYDAYSYFINILNFINCDRCGTYGNWHWSILFPIMIPLPIDKAKGRPKQCLDSWIGPHGGTGREFTTDYDIFFILKIVDNTGGGQTATAANIRTILLRLFEEGKIGNTWPITILGVYEDPDSNDDAPLLLLLCKGFYGYPTEVEWLITNRNQWVDVGLKGNGSQDAFEISFHSTDTAEGNTVKQIRFVSDITTAGATSTNICQMYVNGSLGLSYNPGTTGNWKEISSSYRKVSIHKYTWKVDYKSRTTTINGTTWSNITTQNSTSTLNIGIFAKSGSNYRFIGKFYKFNMWKNGVLSREMVPVRVGNKGYLYDKIQHKLYMSGGNDFTLGPDKSSIYQYVDGITFNGTNAQYIYTDSCPKGTNISFYFKFKVTSWGDSQTYTRLFSTYYADTVQAFRVIKGSNASTLIITCGGKPVTAGNVSFTFTLGRTYEIFCDAVTLTYTIVDELGNIISGALPTPVASPVNITNIEIGDFTRKANFTLYDLKIWNNKVCIANFVPVLLAAGDGALYETISDKIYRNHGAGTITYGDYIAANYITDYQTYADTFIQKAQYIYVDDFRTDPTELQDFIESNGFDNWTDWVDWYLDNNLYIDNRYKYTGDTITLDGVEYYLWQKCDEFGNYNDNTTGNATYIITDTIIYVSLNNRSIEQNHNSTYTVTRLMSDQTVYDTAGSNEQYLVRAESENYSNEYFTVVAEQSGYIALLNIGTGTSKLNMYYSRNGGDWSNTYSTEGMTSGWKKIDVNVGDKIYLECDGAYATTFKANCDFHIEGNFMSIVYGNSFRNKFAMKNGWSNPHALFEEAGDYLTDISNLILPATILTSACYEYMFAWCTRITTAPKLPATTVVTACYRYMFYCCTSLTTAPKLPATTFINTAENTGPYYSMFQGCTSLVNAPELPATTLCPGCYYNMFRNCTSLTTAPELPALELESGCYVGMFWGCTNLNYIKAMFLNPGWSIQVDEDSTIYTLYWVSDVASTGTFVKNAAATYDIKYGHPYIPTGWTVVTASS